MHLFRVVNCRALIKAQSTGRSIIRLVVKGSLSRNLARFGVLYLAYYKEQKKSSMAAAGDQVMDEQFRQRVQQTFATVQAWENEDLLRRCRAELVPDAFYNNSNNQTKNKKTEREAVQILANHFKTKVMTWVNSPPCDTCGTATHVKHHETTGMPLDEHGATCRVEVFRCETCDQTLEFPRYNSIVRLLQSRQGRCGEYANLFGCLCRAVGLETRYILDFTDHGA
jgi:peptide-N4-(N-acetyl-beta-glucosaminyl)asparagine amidase